MTKKKAKEEPKVEEGPHDGEIAAYLAGEMDWLTLKLTMRETSIVDRDYIDRALAEYKERLEIQD